MKPSTVQQLILGTFFSSGVITAVIAGVLFLRSWHVAPVVLTGGLLALLMGALCVGAPRD